MRATPSKGLEKNNTRAQAARAAKGGSSLGSESLMAHQKRKIRTPFGFFFLSKPQAWHIIAAQRAVHIISPFGAVSHHALACIYLRLDDIQHFVLMICNSYGIDDIHAFGVIGFVVKMKPIATGDASLTGREVSCEGRVWRAQDLFYPSRRLGISSPREVR